MSPSNAPEAYSIVPVKANIGAELRRFGIRPEAPVAYIPTTLPFGFIGTPHLYQNDAPSSFPNIYYPRQITPTSAVTTPEPREAFDVSQPRPFNITNGVATQQMPCLISEELRHTNSVTPASGPIRGSSQNQFRPRRRKPYTSPVASSSEPLSLSKSLLAMDRLAVLGICRINNCGSNFDSGSAYRCHLHDVHAISHSKNKTDQVLCPWAGCRRSQSKGSLWNHLLSHGVQAGCGVCDMKLSPRSDTVQKHYRACHGETHENVAISSAELGGFAYLFFSGDGIA